MDLPKGALGSAIKRTRLSKKLTQEKLSELIGITPMHIKQLESERRKPSVEVLYRLVRTLDLSLDSLFSNNGDCELELRKRINLCLNHCTLHELQVAYATIEALTKKRDNSSDMDGEMP